MAHQTGRIALLQAAGFVVLGEAADASGVTPPAAIRAVAVMSVAPRVRTGLTDDSLVATERAWWETARDVDLFDEPATCYLSRHRSRRVHPALASRPCSRASRIPLGAVGENRFPDFVAVSAPGTPVVGVSEEEDENWIVVVR